MLSILEEAANIARVDIVKAQIVLTLSQLRDFLGNQVEAFDSTAPPLEAYVAMIEQG